VFLAPVPRCESEPGERLSNHMTYQVRIRHHSLRHPDALAGALHARCLTGRRISRTQPRGAARSPGAERRGAGWIRGMGRASGPSPRMGTIRRPDAPTA
jgi:hypothetical protein